tara:strand:- start:223 stop:474 length:252 start_codon:yes stop_codon:yes gene_type:complete
MILQNANQSLIVPSAKRDGVQGKLMRLIGTGLVNRISSIHAWFEEWRLRNVGQRHKKRPKWYQSLKVRHSNDNIYKEGEYNDR